MPVDEGTITFGNPWPLPARTLHVDVVSGCSQVSGTIVPTLRVSTHDPEWQRHLESTGSLSSGIPFIRTSAAVGWRNRDTGTTGERVLTGVNGSVSGAAWQVEPGLTDVTVTVTLAPGVPLDVGVIGPRTASGDFTVTVIGCGG